MIIDESLTQWWAFAQGSSECNTFFRPCTWQSLGSNGTLEQFKVAATYENPTLDNQSTVEIGVQKCLD